MTPSGNEQPAKQLWELVPSDDYRIPPGPVTHSVRNRITAFRRLFRNPASEKTAPFTAKDTLQPLSRDRIDTIVPPQDWHAAALVMEQTNRERLGTEAPDQPVMLMIGPPGSGHAHVLCAWAGHSDRQIITPPSAEQILAGDAAVLFGQIDPDRPWVFPVLEQAYIRHAQGLDLIRRFLDKAFSGRLGRGIIGCDSWAWAYLRHIWRGRTAVPFSLQPCEALHLAEHFRRLSDPTGNRPILFRQSDNGLPVLPLQTTEGIPDEAGNFLQFLASHSRGIFGIARAIWRTALRTEPETPMAEGDENQQPATLQPTVWVIPWTRLSLPELPPTAGSDEGVVLHTLLLHKGLESALLPTVLPLSPCRIRETLSRLQEYGLVTRHATIPQVTPLGYPAVRGFLNTQGYPVDQF